MVRNVRDRASCGIPRFSLLPWAAGLLALIAVGCTLDSEGAGASNAGGTGTGGTSTGGMGGSSTGGTGGTSIGGTGGTSIGGTGGMEAGPDADAAAGSAGSGGDAGPEADVLDEPVLGALGDSCTEASACQSGHCVDDVCCESACDGTCESCSAAGACVPHEAGEDPDGDCGACETCDGSGSCASCLSNQVCVSSPDPQDCATADVCVDCSADSQCGTGRCEGCACVNQLPAGEACDEASDCIDSACGAGPAASPNDCSTSGICVECEHNYECTTGRCANCVCASKLGFGSPCVETSDCISSLCGPPPAADPNDCAIDGLCAECAFDYVCTSGRCDECACKDLVTHGGVCNEDSDCQSHTCGPGVASEAQDCDISGHCAECDQDYECTSGRCDGCACLAKLANGEACNELNDCTSNLCGAAPGSDGKDCALQGECIECDADYDCATQRCEGCSCVARLASGEVCDEDTDCVNGNCLGNHHCN